MWRLRYFLSYWDDLRFLCCDTDLGSHLPFITKKRDSTVRGTAPIFVDKHKLKQEEEELLSILQCRFRAESA